MDNEHQELEQKYKVKSSDIKYYDNVAEMRNTHIKNIYEQTLHVNLI